MFSRDMMRAIPGAQAPGGEWDTAAPLRPSGDGGLFEASNEVKCRDLRLQPRLQEDLRFTDGFPGRRKSLVAGREIFLRDLHDPDAPEGVRGAIGNPDFCLVFGRADMLCHTSISRFVPIPGRLSKRRRQARLDHCRSAPLRYGGLTLPPPRSSGVIGTLVAGGIGGLATHRASCGAAALVPVRRNTLPLLLPPARMPPRA